MARGLLGGSFWVRRPLFTAWLLGCTVSLLACGSLTPGRVAESTLTWSWAPLLQIASFGVMWKAGPRSMPFRKAVDLFFAGNVGWWLLLVIFAGGHSLASFRVWLALAALVAAWGCLSDYRLFREDFASAAPLRDLLVQRAAAWAPGILLFGGGSLWPGLLEKLK